MYEIEFESLDDPQLYINRELSMLDFQRRVFEEARDPDIPLLERAKFLSILGSNLDEFFMVRVGGLKMQHDAGLLDLSMDGLTPAQQLAEIRKEALQIMQEAHESWTKDLMPTLNKKGVHIYEYDKLPARRLKQVQEYFEEIVYPVLTPLAFDPGHPFPHISNLSLNLAVVIRDKDGQEHFARVKVPSSLPRLVPLKRSSGGVRKDGTVPYHHYFVWLEQVMAKNLDRLFPGMEIVEAYPFRVTRNADMVIQEWEASDLLETMEESVRRRRFGTVVRLTVDHAMPGYIRNILIENLRMDKKDVYTLDDPIGMRDLIQLYEVDRHDLKESSIAPSIPDAFRGDTHDGNIFATIRQRDLLLHHPYESFTPVTDFIRRAAKDPNVLAIKMTLYRVGLNSPVVRALLEARREYGKQVAVLVELKARFDERSNIDWARKLEQEGVHVVYGLIGLKTHSKILLVVRKEGGAIRRYVHLGTGNYNHITARLYEDIGLFTCNEEIGADASDLFNYLTGYSAKSDYRKLLVAPINMRERIRELISREVELHKKNKKGHLLFKMNSLVDKGIIQQLYKASQAGVKIDLLVRGICCLRPQVKGLSETIRVVSIVGRFLEHSRVFYFHNAGKPEVFLGSADLMPRNLNRRVEVLFPIEDPLLIKRIHEDVLEYYLLDNIKARLMLPDGSYERRKPVEGEPIINSQLGLLERMRSGESLEESD